jgi:lambda repressor-like predicted transcriptional regulator
MRDASKYPKAEDYLVEEIEIPPTLIWLSQQKDSR